MSVRIERSSRVLTVIHSRPEARNVVDPEHAEALHEALLASTRTRTWLPGRGRGLFCADADTQNAWRRATPRRSGLRLIFPMAAGRSRAAGFQSKCEKRVSVGSTAGIGGEPWTVRCCSDSGRNDAGSVPSVRVESKMGAVAWGLWPALRFPSPLIKPCVRVSRTRLSDWLHHKAHDGRPLDAGVVRRHLGS
jgi:hypothetical protein